jgi:putative hydrolase of the HAD superfamily
MFRRLAVRLGVPASCCVLVEDTLVHQKSARRVGMQTVWMQRWLGPHVARPHRRPAYVDLRAKGLRDLRRKP